MTDSIRSRAEPFRKIRGSEADVRTLAAGVAKNKELEDKVNQLTTLVAKINEEMKENKSERADLQQKTQDLQQKIQEITENVVAETKARVIEAAQLRKELDYFKNKFHLSQCRNFWQQFLHAVLTEMDFKPEEIDRASTGELWNMLTKEMYETWRSASEAREQLPTYAQMETMMPTVLAEGNAAVHTSQMMELFDELSITGPNKVIYEPMWYYLADDAEWMKWSALVEAKKQQQQPDQI